MTTIRVAVAVLAVAMTGCGGGSTQAGDNGTDPNADDINGTVTVLAAASLTDVFTALGERFEADHPGATVRFSFAASSELTTQITQGAPADVYASASPTTMAQVTDAGAAAGGPRVFVRNRLAIAVPSDNPGDVRGLADLADKDLTVALCAPEVPCGAAAAKAFAAADVTPAPDTLEQDVKATLAKVELGEVDAALVYRTDIRAAGDEITGIDFPEAEQAVNDYPIVALKDAPNAAAARAFVDLVLSDSGAEVLTAAGFERP